MINKFINRRNLFIMVLSLVTLSFTNCDNVTFTSADEPNSKTTIPDVSRTPNNSGPSEGEKNGSDGGKSITATVSELTADWDESNDSLETKLRKLCDIEKNDTALSEFEDSIFNAPQSTSFVNSTSGNLVLDDYDGLNLSSTSGHVSVSSANQIHATSTSGDINIGYAKLADYIRSTSGDIKAAASYINLIKSTSGAIYATAHTVEKVEMTSGELCLTAVNIEGVERTSGDAGSIVLLGPQNRLGKLNKFAGTSGRYVFVNLEIDSIDVTSGNIYLINSSVANVKATSGSVFLNTESKVTNFSSTSGKILK